MNKKTFIAATTLVAIIASTLTAPSALSPVGHASVELTNAEKLIAFITDVVQLDLSKYDLRVANHGSDPTGGDFVKYTLFNDSTVSNTRIQNMGVTGLFTNGKLINCLLSGSNVTMIYSQQQPSDVLALVKLFVQRYQNFSKATYLEPIFDTLNSMTELASVTKTSGNATLTVRLMDYGVVRFEWTGLVNGITNQYATFGFGFQNGAFDFFNDDWTHYVISEVQIKISREEAISRAKEHGAQYAIDQGIYSGSPNILYNGTYASLTMQPRADGKVYPQWEINLPFEKTFPEPLKIGPDDPNYWFLKFYYDGAVSFYYSQQTNGIHITMRADTGEVARVFTGVMSEIPLSADLSIVNTPTSSAPSPTTTSTQSPQPSPTSLPSAAPSPTQQLTTEPSSSASPPLIVDHFPNYPLMLQLGIVAVVMVVVVGLLVHFKRIKK